MKHITLLSFIFLLLCASFLHADFRDALKKEIASKKILNRITFRLETDPHYTNEFNVVYQPWSAVNKPLKEELKRSRLYYFWQFQEHLLLLRRAAKLSLTEICWAESYNMKLDPAFHKEHKKRMNEAKEEYNLSLTNLDFLQSRVVQEFQKHYNNFNSSWHTAGTIYDQGLFELAQGNVETAVYFADAFIDRIKEYDDDDDDFLTSERCLNIGITYSEALEYSKAIDYLTQAITEDPNNKIAYLERAVAYFETAQFDKAVSDYVVVSKEQISLMENSPSGAFSKALLQGLAQGAREGAVDYLPSLLSSMYGLSQTTWAILEHPLDHSSAFANACYDAGNCMAEYFKTNDLSSMENDLLEGIDSLFAAYDNLPDAEKGMMIGSLVGKYGIEILLPGTAIKGLNTYKNLRAANRLCTLEAMAVSTINKEVLVSSAMQHAAKREAYFKNVKYNFDAHHKHIVGHNDFDPRKSIWQHKDPEGLLKRFAGTGRPEQGILGVPGFRETVDFKEHIGIWKDKDNLFSLPTTRGTIHYGKKGAHIVPSTPTHVIESKLGRSP